MNRYEAYMNDYRQVCYEWLHKWFGPIKAERFRKCMTDFGHIIPVGAIYAKGASDSE